MNIYIEIYYIQYIHTNYIHSIIVYIQLVIRVGLVSPLIAYLGTQPVSVNPRLCKQDMPYAPCMVYLPTCTIKINYSWIGNYSFRPMEHLGMPGDSIFVPPHRWRSRSQNGQVAR